MSSITLFEATVPVFIRGMTNLSAVLAKGQAFADEQKLEHSKLVNGKLIADMGDLTFQIQRVSDCCKFAAVRIGSVPSVSMADDEKTFEDLQARLTKTIDFLKTVDPSTMAGKEDTEITIKTKAGDRVFSARDYVFQFALPNFFFHITTAYAVLRAQGAPVGKWDYLG